MKPLNDYQSRILHCPKCNAHLFVSDSLLKKKTKIWKWMLAIGIGIIIMGVFALASPGSPISVDWQNKTIFIKVEHTITIDPSVYQNIDEMLQRYGIEDEVNTTEIIEKINNIKI